MTERWRFDLRGEMYNIFNHAIFNVPGFTFGTADGATGNAAEFLRQNEAMLPSEPGVYVLVLRSAGSCAIRVGRLGTLAVQPGFYLYVGSARGSGGIRARVEHHARRAASPHWHIDYLRRRARLIEVWHAAEAGEHALAATLGALPGAVAPMPRFGSSDCDCWTHLFWFATFPPIPVGFSRVPLGG